MGGLRAGRGCLLLLLLLLSDLDGRLSHNTEDAKELSVCSRKSERDLETENDDAHVRIQITIFEFESTLVHTLRKMRGTLCNCLTLSSSVTLPRLADASYATLNNTL